MGSERLQSPSAIRGLIASYQYSEFYMEYVLMHSHWKPSVPSGMAAPTPGGAQVVRMNTLGESQIPAYSHVKCPDICS